MRNGRKDLDKIWSRDLSLLQILWSGITHRLAKPQPEGSNSINVRKDTLKMLYNLKTSLEGDRNKDNSVNQQKLDISLVRASCVNLRD